MLGSLGRLDDQNLTVTLSRGCQLQVHAVQNVRVCGRRAIKDRLRQRTRPPQANGPTILTQVQHACAGATTRERQIDHCPLRTDPPVRTPLECRVDGLPGVVVLLDTLGSCGLRQREGSVGVGVRRGVLAASRRHLHLLPRSLRLGKSRGLVHHS